MLILSVHTNTALIFDLRHT